jgi:small-conductance mechanosensitive channel
MKIVMIAFVLITFSVVQALILSGETDAVTIPTLNAPDTDFNDFPDDCSGFFDCTEYVGQVLIVIGQAIIYVVLLIVALLIFLVQFTAFLAESQFTGVDGAPPWVNLLLSLPFLLAIGLFLFKALRKGDTDA